MRRRGRLESLVLPLITIEVILDIMLTRKEKDEGLNNNEQSKYGRIDGILW